MANQLFGQGIDAAGLGLAISGVLLGALLVALVGGILIRLSCWLHNRFVGGPGNPSAVPHPTIGRAAMIGLICTLLQGGVVVALLWSGLMDAAPHAGQTLAVAVNFLLTATVLKAMLPTRFGRGLAVAAMPYLVMGFLTALSCS